jgi:predicted peptidase
MKTSSILVLAFLFLGPTVSFSQNLDSLFQSNAFTSGAGESMPYRLFIPVSYDSSKQYPIVVWLHGAIGRGNDNRRNISGANELGSHLWTSEASQKNNPCFVVAPQCPDTSLWVSNDGIDTPADQLDAVVELLGELRHAYNIDSDRVYVAGQSMGGVAVWEIIARYPAIFAAALPLCGIGNTYKASSMTHTAIWAFHGTADSVIPVKHSREMIQAVKKAGGHPKYTEYRGVGHEVWKIAFKEKNLLRWVFAQKRGYQ